MIRVLRVLSLAMLWGGAGLAIAGLKIAGLQLWWIGVLLAAGIGIYGLGGANRRIPV
jgi:hypothetical protein